MESEGYFQQFSSFSYCLSLLVLSILLIILSWTELLSNVKIASE